ncbi:MAG: hypothetical protein U5N86_12180 [Planctomycetota bacterium]|nr:hypothetical protein [Planctomycetota bacterium]
MIADIVLDSFIVSATTFDDLRRKTNDGSWDRQKFTEAHILFPENAPGKKSYIGALLCLDEN